MSVFKVKLNQGLQGSLDTSLTNGVSAQRTIMIPGPNGVLTRRNDGETFTETNYYKRYTTSAVSADLAFLQTLTDDGSTWSDNGTNTILRVANFTVNAATTYAAHTLDILSTYGGPSIFTQIVVTGDEVNIQLNGSTDAIMSLPVGTQIFDNGDLELTSIAFDNSESGASNATVQVLMSIRLTSNT